MRQSSKIPALIVCLILSLSPAASETLPPAAPRPHQDIRKISEAGHYGEAEALARTRLAEMESLHGADSAEVADVLDILVEALWQGGKVKNGEARSLAERAIRIREAAPGGRPEDLASSFKQLASVLSKSGDLAGARQAYERTVALREQAFGPDDYRVGKAYSDLGTTYARSGDYAGARTHFERGLAISRKGLPPGDPDLGFSLINLASLHYVMAEYDAARPLYQEALAVWEKAYGPEHPRVGDVLLNLSGLLFITGDYAGALQLYPRALAVLRKSLGENHPSVAHCLRNYGEALRQTGDPAAARPLLERAIEIQRSKLNANDPQMVPALENLAGVVFDLEDHAEARTLLEKSLVILEKNYGPEHPDHVSILTNLGGVLLEMEDLDAAGAILEKAARIAAKVLDPNHPLVAALDHQRGVDGLRRGDLRRATKFFEDALAIRRAQLGDRHPHVAYTLDQLAVALYGAGVRNAALARADEATRILDQFVRETVQVLPETRALKLRAGLPRPESLLFSGLLSDADNRAGWLQACWQWTLRHRGLMVEEMTARRMTADSSGDPAVRNAWARLSQARDRVASAWVKGTAAAPGAAAAADLEAARKEKEEAETALVAASARFRRRQEFAPASPAEVSAALPPGSILIEIVRVPFRSDHGVRVDGPGPARYIALKLDTAGAMSFADLGAAAEIDDIVGAWRGALKSAAGHEGDAPRMTSALQTAGKHLAERAWLPLEPLIGTARELFLVPDGALHQVAFAALPIGDGRALIETDLRINMLNTGRDIVRLQSPQARTAPGTGLLALGNPAFPGMASASGASRAASLPCPLLLQEVWSPLPESGREVSRIASFFEGRESTTVLTGDAATEAKLKQAAPGHRVLHLATHGYFLGDDCADKTVNPLLLSGLALAGAGATGASSDAEDGFLTAEEVAGLDLSTTDLTVLSACDTGLGEFATGEGVFGLRRALEIAGSRTVIMTLWPVPDRQARRWMTAFYQSWTQGRAVGEASREASRQLLTDLRRQGRDPHPYLWGGFVAVGDWRGAVPESAP